MHPPTRLSQLMTGRLASMRRLLLLLLVLLAHEACAQTKGLFRRRRNRRLQGAGNACQPQGWTNPCNSGLECVCWGQGGSSARMLEENEGRRLFGAQGRSASGITCTCTAAPPPPSPPPASPPPPLHLVMGGHHVFAALPYPNAKIWGWNTNGALGIGDGSTSHKNNPTPINTLGAEPEFVVMGWHHTCAKLVDGTFKCWGYNPYGNIGDGSTTNRNLPTTINVGGTVQAAACGVYHTCVALTTGVVKCWGYNNCALHPPCLPMPPLAPRSAPFTCLDALCGPHRWPGW